MEEELRPEPEPLRGCVVDITAPTPEPCAEDCDSEDECCEEPCGACCCEAPSPRNNKIRPISIRQLNRGFIIDVGCHSFAFETADNLIEKLSMYLKDPNGTESQWYADKLF